MPAFTIRVSQRVFYDVEVEAETSTAALTLVHRALTDPDPGAPDLADWPMVEVDSSEYEVDPAQWKDGDAEFNSAMTLWRKAVPV